MSICQYFITATVILFIHSHSSKKFFPEPNISWPWHHLCYINFLHITWLRPGGCFSISRPSPPPPRNWKAKKKVIRANFELFHLYLATFLVENVIFSAIFWAAPPHKKIEKQKKKLSDIAPPPLRIPRHAPDDLCSLDFCIF